MKRMMLLLVAYIFIALVPARSLESGLARTPPMGWINWNKFGCDVSEKLIKETAGAMVTSGMRDARYQCLVIDDCWQVSRDGEAAWGVDCLKYDWCNHGTQEVKSSHGTMRDALKASGRPIVFSLCE